MTGANKRFEDVYLQGILDVSKIIRDNETGVLYLYHYSGTSAGSAVMVDKGFSPETPDYC